MDIDFASESGVMPTVDEDKKKVVLKAEELAFGKIAIPESNTLLLAQEVVQILENQLKGIVGNVLKLGETVVFQILDGMVAELQKLRTQLTPDQEPILRAFFREKILPLTQESEFCNYAFTKPRGYPGDFGAMELIWKGRTQPKEFRYRGSSEAGKLINAFTLDMANCRANEYRVFFLKDLINQFKPLNLASIGCGSAIELDNNQSIQKISLFDQDSGALQAAQSRLSHIYFAVTLVHGNIVKNILKTEPDSFDFIYSSGLFDYFDQDAAQKLAGRLWRALHPGGVICITNAHPNNPTQLWMDYVGDWKLVNRDLFKILDVFEDFRDISKVIIDKDPYSVYQYIQVHKR